jgi:hypothetical protein
MGRPTKTSRGSCGRLCSARLVASALCASAVATLAGTAVAASGTYALTAHLKTMPSTVHARHATGGFKGTLKLAGNNSTFTWTLKFGQLSGAVRRAGIYFGKVAKPSKLALLLCTKCSSGVESYYHGSYVAGTRFVRAILRGRAYVVIQTKRNPKGEMRGRIRAKAA